MSSWVIHLGVACQLKERHLLGGKKGPCLHQPLQSHAAVPWPQAGARIRNDVHLVPLAPHHTPCPIHHCTRQPSPRVCYTFDDTMEPDDNYLQTDLSDFIAAFIALSRGHHMERQSRHSSRHGV